jgi:hypothetical protein
VPSNVDAAVEVGGVCAFADASTPKNPQIQSSLLFFDIGVSSLVIRFPCWIIFCLGSLGERKSSTQAGPKAAFFVRAASV